MEQLRRKPLVVDLRSFNTLCFGGMGLASSVSMVLAGRISELVRQPEQLTLLRRMLAGIFGLRGRETHLCKYVASVPGLEEIRAHIDGIRTLFEALTGQDLEDMPSSEEIQKHCIVVQLSDGSKGTSSCEDDPQCPIAILPTNTFPFGLGTHDLVSVANEVWTLDREASRLHPEYTRRCNEQSINQFLVAQLGLMVSPNKNIVRAISHNAKLGFLLGYTTYAKSIPAVRDELLNLSRDAESSGASYDHVIVSE